jgi:hypothetical protein
VKKESIQPFVLGMAVGAIVLLIVIFWAGWVVTQSSAQAEARQTAEKTVLDKLVPICVDQFQKDPNKEERLKELEGKSSWDRGDYVKKQGWATMPGSKSPDQDVADECAKRIAELSK